MALTTAGAEGNELHVNTDDFRQPQRLHEIDNPIEQGIENTAVASDDCHSYGGLLMEILIRHLSDGNVETMPAFFNETLDHLALFLE